VLLQHDDSGAERPVAFVSKPSNETERKLSTIEQEAFAVYFCIRQLEHYLRGHDVIIETDHRNRTYMYKSTTPKVVRWRLALMEHRYVVRHIAGKHNQVADGLSRVLATAAAETGDDHGNDKDSRRQRISAVHNSVVGHRGINKTVELLKQQGDDWPDVRNAVSEYIKACATCQKTRLGQGSMAAAVRTTAVREPFEAVAVDTIGPLPEDDMGNRYIVTLIDCFTRFVELVPSKSASAQAAAGALLQVFGRYGAPREVRSDQGAQYTAAVVQQVVRLAGADNRYTLPYRPQANGTVERANGEVMRHLRAVVFDKDVSSNWSNYLPLVQRLINATPHSAIGTTPARVLFGDRVHLDRELLSTEDRTQDKETTVEDYVQELTRAQQAVLAASQRHHDGVIKQ
jgi:transposase InsO family protein